MRPCGLPFADDDKVWILDFETAGTIGDKPSPIRTFDIKPEFCDARTADLAHFLASVLYPYDEDDRDGRANRSFDLRAWSVKDSETATAAWARDKLRELLN